MPFGVGCRLFGVGFKCFVFGVGPNADKRRWRHSGQDVKRHISSQLASWARALNMTSQRLRTHTSGSTQVGNVVQHVPDAWADIQARLHRKICPEMVYLSDD